MGQSDCPREQYTIEGWADEGATLLDAVELDRVLVHGASMGGMVAIAFAGRHSHRAIAASSDGGVREARSGSADVHARMAPDGRLDAVGYLV